MKTRILTGVVALITLILLIFSPAYIFNVACVFLSLAAFYEVQKAAGIIKIPALAVLNFVFSVFLLVSLRINLEATVAVLVTYMFSLFILMIFDYADVNLENVVTSLFFIIYTICLIHFIVLIRENIHGLIYLAILLVGVFATDTCAYFTGVFLGKHKLCPLISPKKTIEGSIGGWTGCILLLIITGLILTKSGYPVNYIYLILFGLICGGLSQIGDLTASIIKRHYGIKDYGNLLPGHGGIMDRLDSILLVAPVLYLFIVYLPLF